MDADAALAELTDLSAQIESAAVLDEDGAVLGSTPGSRGAELARASSEALATAAGLRPGATPTRVELLLPGGGLFVVAEGRRRIAATTTPKPTAGLVVYDLRACLRRLAGETGTAHA
ncbi:MAG TPA: hypothetical protein VH950_00910 [Gaiellaceae bacterium]|jgi:hypothetical protein